MNRQSTLRCRCTQPTAASLKCASLIRDVDAAIPLRRNFQQFRRLCSTALKDVILIHEGRNQRLQRSDSARANPSGARSKRSRNGRLETGANIALVTTLRAKHHATKSHSFHTWHFFRVHSRQHVHSGQSGHSQRHVPIGTPSEKEAAAKVRS